MLNSCIYVVSLSLLCGQLELQVADTLKEHHMLTLSTILQANIFIMKQLQTVVSSHDGQSKQNKNKL